jgi:hypothetical protein
MRARRPVALWDSSTRTRARTKRVPARHVQHQNGACAKCRGNPVCRPSTACGRPEVYTRGRCRRYTEGFRGGLDSLPSIVGSESHRSWVLGAVRRWAWPGRTATARPVRRSRSPTKKDSTDECEGFPKSLSDARSRLISQGFPGVALFFQNQIVLGTCLATR